MKFLFEEGSKMLKGIDIQEISSVMERTEKILQSEPETRSSDKLLIKRYMKVFHGVDIDIPNDAPSFETIRRDRQIIQSQGRYKADETIQELRAENQVTFSNFTKS
jgi:hypothetical protein